MNDNSFYLHKTKQVEGDFQGRQLLNAEYRVISVIYLLIFIQVKENLGIPK